MINLRTFQNKTICVAISGGADSVALTHYLKTQSKEYGFSLRALHCQHGIRGEESLEDMRFVVAICKEWDIPLTVVEGDCLALAKQNGQSVETAAREFRRAAYARMIDEKKADFIATAHHLSDQAETVLFRLARGSALSGVAGMREQDGYILRPFLTKTKEDIYAYCQTYGLAYRVDKTNLSTEYTRNQLRLEVLPALENAVCGAQENLARFAAIAAEDDEYLYALSEKLLTVGDREMRVAFAKEKPLFRRACLLALKRLGLTKDYTFAHLESLYALQYAQRGARCDLPCGVTASKETDGLRIFYASDTPVFPPAPTTSAPFSEGEFDGGMYKVSVSKTPPTTGNALRIDGDSIPQNAVFRFRQDGDEIQAFGGGTKTLKKFFNEKKTEVRQRAYLPLIAADKEVYVVCGVDISRKCMVTKNTKTVYYITIEKAKNATD